MNFSFKNLVLTTALFSTLWAFPALAEAEKQPVNLSADHLTHDDKNQTIVASGNVEMVQGGRIMRADKVVYNLSEDKITAIGNISLLDESGDVYFSEKAEFTDKMKKSFVLGLKGLLADGSTVTAERGYRELGVKTKMENATYTPCKPCEDDPEAEPLWQIKASNVVLDEEEKQVRYKNARLEFFGVPMAYSPIFMHPSPDVKRKSGFLRPGLSWSSDTGAEVDTRYYWSIAEDKDATFRAEASELGLLLGVEWRQRFKDGELYIDTSGTRSDRVVENGGIEITEEDEWRGHVFARGKYDINEKWRAGFDVSKVSDKEYLRLYDISDEDILENELFAERFSGRNYTKASFLTFEDVRLNVADDQPDILPLFEHQMIGEPKALLGGRWDASVNGLGLNRSDGQDVVRGGLELGWQRDIISRNGLKTTIKGKATGEAYSATDIPPAISPNTESEEGRLNARVQVKGSYPMMRAGGNYVSVIEPIAAITTGPQRNDQTDIPNEDSADVQLDASNLFELNRFPGIDRQEDGTNIAYGIKGGLYTYGQNAITGFIGQSYRFDDDDLFPDGSGLEDNMSDVVGQVGLMTAPVNFDYRFQLDYNDLAPRRHELDANGTIDRLTWRARYLFNRSVVGTGFTESREEIRYGGSYKWTDHWTTSMAAVHNLGEDPGLRQASAGLSYEDECFSFSALGYRDFSDRSSGAQDTTLMLRFGLKNIGEFETPEILLGEEKEQ